MTGLRSHQPLRLPNSKIWKSRVSALPVSLAPGAALSHRGDQALDVNRLDAVQGQAAEPGRKVGSKQRAVSVQRRGLAAESSQVADQLVTGLLHGAPFPRCKRRDR